MVTVDIENFPEGHRGHHMTDEIVGVIGILICTIPPAHIVDIVTVMAAEIFTDQTGIVGSQVMVDRITLLLLEDMVNGNQQRGILNHGPGHIYAWTVTVAIRHTDTNGDTRTGMTGVTDEKEDAVTMTQTHLASAPWVVMFLTMPPGRDGTRNIQQVTNIPNQQTK